MNTNNSSKINEGLILLQGDGKEWYLEQMESISYLRGLGAPNAKIIFTDTVANFECDCSQFDGTSCAHREAMHILKYVDWRKAVQPKTTYRNLKHEVGEHQLKRFVDAVCRQDIYFSKVFAMQFAHLKKPESSLYAQYQHIIESILKIIGKKKVRLGQKKVIEFFKDGLRLQEDLWIQTYFFAAIDLGLALITAISDVLDHNREIYSSIFSKSHELLVRQFNTLESPETKEKLYHKIWSVVLLKDYQIIYFRENLFLKLVEWRKFSSSNRIKYLLEKLNCTPSIDSKKIQTRSWIIVGTDEQLKELIKLHIYESWYADYLVDLAMEREIEDRILFELIEEIKYKKVLDSLAIYVSRTLEKESQYYRLLELLKSEDVLIVILNNWRVKLESKHYTMLLSDLIEFKIPFVHRLLALLQLERIDEAVRMIDSIDVLIPHLTLLNSHAPFETEKLLINSIDNYLANHYGQHAREKIRVLKRKLNQGNFKKLEEVLDELIITRYSHRKTLTDF